MPSLTMTMADLQFRLNEASNPAPTALVSDAWPSPLPVLPDFTTEQIMTVLGYSSGDVTNFDVAIIDFGPVGSPDLPLIPNSVTVKMDGTVTWTFSTLGITLCISGC